MSLAPNYQTILQEGIAALDEITAELATVLGHERASPEQVLRLRDVSGFAARLAAMTPDQWRFRLGLSPFTGQDLGVLTELIDEDEASSPYREDPRAAGRRARAQRLRALSDFLVTWEPEPYDPRLNTEEQDAASSPGGTRQHRDQQQN